jgi:hypothetical protein
VLSSGLTCVGLGALSLLIPSAPTTDSWGWILWGREVVNLELSTELGSSPSWKPLPVLLTAPLSLAGEVAPTLWILVVRSFGLAGLALAFVMAGRLASVRSPWLFASAGVLAVVGILATRGWLRDFWHGYSEPLALALLLAGIERHLSGKRIQALLLGAAVASVRPEVFGVVVIYAALLVWREQVTLPKVAAVLVAIPAVWLIPDWIGSGDPFHGLTVAAEVLEEEPTLTFGLHILPVPLVVASVAAAAAAVWQRDRAFLQVAALAWAWYLALRVLILFGYPTAWRFFFLPAALLCVVGAAGLMKLVSLSPAKWIRALLAAAAFALLALSILPRADRRIAVVSNSITRSEVERDLWRALDRAGGAELSRCGEPVLPRGFRWMKGVVSWSLGLSLAEVGHAHTRNSIGISRPLREGAARRIWLENDSGSSTRAVSVAVPPRPVVMVLPFAGVPVKLIGNARPRRIRKLGSYGQWLVATSPSARCKPDPSRER